jgi:hypothetical protein
MMGIQPYLAAVSGRGNFLILGFRLRMKLSRIEKTIAEIRGYGTIVLVF